MMNKEMVEKLREEARKNPAANAVFLVFALRDRTSATISLTNLTNAMHKAGFRYSKDEYAEVLKFLSTLSIGTLKISPRGHTRGLVDIKYTLQSIGRVSCNPNKEENIKNYNPKRKFRSLVSVPAVHHISAQPESVEPTTPTPFFNSLDSKVTADNMRLVININGKSLQIPIPREFNKEDINTIIDICSKVK